MNQPTNYRQTRRKQERVLLILVLFVLVVIGSGLIGLIWGIGQALQSLVCLIPGAIIIIGLWLLLGWIQKLVDN